MGSHPILKFIPEPPTKARRPIQDRRSLRITLLLSREEKDLLHEMARERECTISTVLRAALDAVPPTRINNEAIQELHRIGASLAQFGRDAYLGAPDPEALIEEILVTQGLYQRLLMELEP